MSKLISGESKSCGCKRRELYENGAYTEGHRTKLYNTWLGMRERCYNKSNISYKNYGGKGVSVCDEWGLFETFKSWAYANGYKEGLTIDRKDINKGYCPENCQWANYITQANNTSRNIFITYNGSRMTIAEWARTMWVNYRTLYNALRVDKRMGKIRKFFPNANNDNFLISEQS